MTTTVPMIPLSVPVFAGNEHQYVRECLDTGWVSSAGPFVARFEESVARTCGAQYGVAVVNGTAALHLALLVVGVTPQDLVLVPTLTFVATANAVRYCGAHPVFLDCDPDTLGLDVPKLVAFLDHACHRRDDGVFVHTASGRRIAAVIPVHVFGHPVDMDPLIVECHRRGVVVIEDATESLGSRYRGRPLGCLGDIGCCSFNGNKIVTAGGGGVVVTNRADLAERVRHLSTQATVDAVASDHDAVGYNYRLTNLQAAVGLAQLEQLNTFVAVRRAHRARYHRLLAAVPGVEILGDAPWAEGNAWLTTLRLPTPDARAVVDALAHRGIEARPVWKLLHTLPMYGHEIVGDVATACAVAPRCVNIPSSANLTDADAVRVVDAMRASLSVGVLA